MKIFEPEAYGTYALVTSVLEIGVGVGPLTKRICCEAGKVYAFDVSINNLVYTRNNRIKNNVFLLGSTLEIPFSDNFFDIVVASEVIEHVLGLKRMINKVGMLYLLDPSLALGDLNKSEIGAEWEYRTGVLSCAFKEIVA